MGSNENVKMCSRPALALSAKAFARPKRPLRPQLASFGGCGAAVRPRWGVSGGGPVWMTRSRGSCTRSWARRAAAVRIDAPAAAYASLLALSPAAAHASPLARPSPLAGRVGARHSRHKSSRAAAQHTRVPPPTVPITVADVVDDFLPTRGCTAPSDPSGGGMRCVWCGSSSTAAGRYPARGGVGAHRAVADAAYAAAVARRAGAPEAAVGATAGGDEEYDSDGYYS